jgi:hypothetical protein
MLEFPSRQPLFMFLGVPKLPKRHWSAGARWERADCMYHQVQAQTKVIMQASRFFSITCDVVTTLDTQSWISVYGYVCENWTRKPLLLSLERVVEGSGSDNLIKVIVEAAKRTSGVEGSELQSRLASFGAGKIQHPPFFI